ISMRADFYDRPLNYPEFGELVCAHMETVMPLSAKGLERGISGPAERVGVRFEPGLVAAIVAEMNLGVTQLRAEHTWDKPSKGQPPSEECRVCCRKWTSECASDDIPGASKHAEPDRCGCAASVPDE